MSKNSKIEWCDHTFNPAIGCTKISPACDRCYAEVSTPARAMGIKWGAGEARHRTAPSTWAQPLAWNKAHDKFFAIHGRRQRVFCASLADVFDNQWDPQWRADLWKLIIATPNLDWLLLTKRIGNVEAMALAAGGWPGNAQLGLTVVNQPEANRDIPKALHIKKRLAIQVLFVSAEPLLGPLQLSRLSTLDFEEDHEGAEIYPLRGLYAVPDCDWKGPKIDWVIAGGESGPGARPSHPEWYRSLRDQCAAAGVPFLFKQWGEYGPDLEGDQVCSNCKLTYREISRELKNDTSCANCGCDTWLPSPTPATEVYKMGKKAAGRLLDGIEHNGFPV